MRIKSLDVERMKLEEPREIKVGEGEEAYIHLLTGKCAVSMMKYSEEGFILGPRESVFSPPVGGLLCSAGTFEICPRDHADVVVARSARGPSVPSEPDLVTPKLHVIGDGNARRKVYEILGGDGPAQRLRCGETVNERGGWSSWPPHEFDRRPDLAKDFEEIFLCFTKPRNGYGMMARRGTWTDGSMIDDIVQVTSGLMIPVPLGSHPIVASPETELMYVWFYLSPVPKVYGKWAEDAGTYL